MALSGDLLAFITFSKALWRCLAFSGLVWGSMALSVLLCRSLGLSGALCGSLALSGALWGCLPFPEALWSSLGLFGALGGSLPLSVALWRCLALSGALFLGALWLLLVFCVVIWRHVLAPAAGFPHVPPQRTGSISGCSKHRWEPARIGSDDLEGKLPIPQAQRCCGIGKLPSKSTLFIRADSQRRF